MSEQRARWRVDWESFLAERYAAGRSGTVTEQTVIKIQEDAHRAGWEACEAQVIADRERVQLLEAVIREYLDACHDAAKSWSAREWDNSWSQGKRMDRAHDALAAALARPAATGAADDR